ncbi:CPBP family intramembrane glutamic endopeptidase [Oceanobacillus jeddahense]|uniref:CPBP family intramembrane metalloprotease n=1 Tax=Oceanobacillus jeddahense TaxID=1462527 RepID=A0ABY5JM56_9BACI|nr:CPBP family intramembrane glutamic endopeptidase [Oceanobacillus jeddahense]UUI01382.1 CPBP family intramembrane metalloprotease [Oceanobacillus jeddahense]
MKNGKYHWIVYTGLILIGAAAVWIITQNDGMIETSADHDMTIPFWYNWVISGVLVLLIGIFGNSSSNNPFTDVNKKVLIQQTVILTAAALLFVVGLLIVPNENVFTYFPVFKIVLLLIVPIAMFSMYKEKNAHYKDSTKKTSYLKNNQWFFPLLITAAWVALYFFSPVSMPQAPEYEMGLSMLIIGAFRTFVISSVLEEFFYRVWLQTRLEALLGIWPAIMVSALLWAVWHMAIQGGDSADIAFSNVLVNQGVMGLFLGFLWAKYRNVWVLMIIHGLINLPLQIITILF